MASTEDWGSGQTNPAGIAFAEEISVTLGAFAAEPRLKVQYAGSPERALNAFPGRAKDLETNVGPILGMVLPFEDMFDQEMPFPAAAGFMLYLPGESLFVQRAFRDQELVDVVFQERNLAAGLQIYMAIRLHPAVSLGGGMTFNMANPTELSPIAAPDGRQFASTSVDTQLSPSLTLGLQIRPSDRFFFGVSFIQRQRWSQTGTLSPSVGVVTGAYPYIPPVPILGSGPLTFPYKFQTSYTPMQVTVGAAYQVTERLQVDAALQYQQWSDYKTFQRTEPPNPLRDTWTPRVGVEYRLARDLALRAGLAFEPTPVTQQPEGFNLLGADRWIPSAGLAWSFEDPFGYLDKPLTLEIAGFAHVLEERRFDADKAGPPPLGAYLDPFEELLLSILVPNYRAALDVDEPHAERGFVAGGTATLTFTF